MTSFLCFLTHAQREPTTHLSRGLWPYDGTRPYEVLLHRIDTHSGGRHQIGYPPGSICDHDRRYTIYLYFPGPRGEIPFPCLEIVFVRHCWDCKTKLRPRVAEVVLQLERAAGGWGGVMQPCIQVERIVSASSDSLRLYGAWWVLGSDSLILFH